LVIECQHPIKVELTQALLDISANLLVLQMLPLRRERVSGMALS